MDGPTLLEYNSIRTLRISASHTPFRSLADRATAIKAAIFEARPSFLEVVVVYEEKYFAYAPNWRSLHSCNGTNTATCWECQRLIGQIERWKMLEEAYRERKFRLVFCAEVPRSRVDDAMKMLEFDVSMVRQNSRSAEFLASVTIISAVPRISDIPSPRYYCHTSSANFLASRSRRTRLPMF